MALNPRGQLPTFKDGDVVLNESGAIVMYLENQYPEKPLLPSTPVEKAKVVVARTSPILRRMLGPGVTAILRSHRNRHEATKLHLPDGRVSIC